MPLYSSMMMSKDMRNNNTNQHGRSSGFIPGLLQPEADCSMADPRKK